MAWLAATFQGELNAGTELAIFKEPWDPEAMLPEQLPASVELGIDFPDGAGAVVWVRRDRLRSNNPDFRSNQMADGLSRTERIEIPTAVERGCSVHLLES